MVYSGLYVEFLVLHCVWEGCTEVGDGRSES